jgi:hypothetical protein
MLMVISGELTPEISSLYSHLWKPRPSFEPRILTGYVELLLFISMTITGAETNGDHDGNNR